MVRRSFGIGSAFFALALTVGAGSAFAQADVMKACGAEWQAAKTAKTVKPGETWKSFLADCRTRQAAKPAAAAPAAAKPAVAAPAPAATAPAAAPAAPAKPAAVTPAKPAAATTPAAKPAAAPSAGRAAETARMKTCGAEWKADKAAGKIPAGQKWPQYWSACNTRLKAAGQ